MRATGITRRVDDLGRFVLPAEIRRTLDIALGDALEIFTDGDRIILKKYEPSCTFCESADDVIPFGDKRICRTCLKKLKAL